MKLIKDEILKKLLDKGETVIIAVSTGIDSMSLFHYLFNNGYKIVVAHVNHKKRIESDQEYEFLEKYTKDLGVPFEGYILPKIESGNFQEKARELRYEFLKRVADKYGTKQIVTAHQADDLVETIIMRLSRGSSFRGYAGINPSFEKDGYKIIRPLLYTKKADIENYQKEMNVPFFLDKTNTEDNYTRNKIRHKVVPVIEDINSSYCDAFMNFSSDIIDAYKLINKLSSDFLKRSALISDNEVSFSIKDYMLLDDVIKKDVVLKSINIISNNTLELTHEKLMKIAEFGENQKESKEIELSGDISLYIEYSKFVFARKINSVKIDLVINDFGRFHLSPSKDIVVSKEYHNLKEKTSYLLCYNSKEVIFPIYVRNIKDGDKITVCGITKTIKDLLKDNKIPKRMRDNYLVLSNKDGNFFVPGVIRKETDTSKELKMYITIEERQNENR